MKKFLSLLVLAAALMPAATFADNGNKPYESPNKYLPNTGMEDTPLVVIRFNKEQNVMYQIPLQNAVKKAMHVYPGAFFEIVSLIPTTGSYKEDEDAAMTAAANARRVMQTMTEIGLPPERFQTNYTTTSTLGLNEIRIFVR